MASTIAQLVIELRAGTAKLATDLNQSVRELSKFANRTQTIGRSLTYNLTAPLALIGGSAIKAASDFESAFAGVKKTFKGFDTNSKQGIEVLGALSGAIREMATELPTSAAQIAKVVELGQQFGVPTQHVIDFAKAIVNLGESTNLGMEEGAQALAQFAYVTGVADDKFQNLASAIVYLGNNSRTTERDIVNMATRIAGAGGLSGVAAADILGLSAALASTALESEAGGTAISKLIQKMSRAASGSGGLEQFAYITSKANSELKNLSEQGFADLFKNNPGDALTAFFKGFQNLKNEGAGVYAILDSLDLQEVRLIDTTLRAVLTSDKLTKSVVDARMAFEEATFAEAEANERRKTFASQMLVLKNNVNEVAISFGQLFLPALLSITKSLVEVVKYLNQLPEGMKKAIGFAGAFLAIVGPTTIAVAAMAKSVSQLYAVMRLFGGAIGIPQLSKLGAGIQTVGNTAATASPQITALGGAATTAGGLLASLTGIVASTFTGLAGFVGIGGLLGADMKYLALGTVDFVKALAAEIPGAIRLILTTGGDLLTSALNSKWDNIRTNFSWLVDQIASLWGTLRSILPDRANEIIDKLIEKFTYLKDQIALKFSEIGDSIYNVYKSVSEKFKLGLQVIGGKIGSNNLKAAGGDTSAKQEIALTNEIIDKTKKLVTERERLIELAHKSGLAVVGEKEAQKKATAALIKELKDHGIEVEKVSEEEKKLNKEYEKRQEHLKDIKKEYKDLQNEIAATKIKEEIETAIAEGNSVSLAPLYDKLKENIKQSVIDGHAEAADSPEAKKAVEQLAELQAEEQIRVDREKTQKELLKQAEETHKKSVDFWKGLMEDAISGTRFNWKEQFSKAAVEIAAEFLTNMLEANALASKSFGDFFDKTISALGSSFESYFGSALTQFGISGGAATAGSSSGSLIAGSNEAIASALTASGIEVASAATAAADAAAASEATLAALTASGSSEAATLGTASTSTAAGMSIASMATIAGAVVTALFVGKTNFDNFSSWGSSTSNEKKGLNAITAAIDSIFPGVGSGISQAAGFLGFGGASSLTGNQQSLKGFEKWVEDTLKKNLGNALNFAVSDINQFDQAGWGEKFWGDFGDKGASTFAALGAGFEQLMGLEKGTGSQIGALLAQNLAGGTTEESLNNIKTFLDATGVSTQQLTDSLLQMAKASNLTWSEFESMRQSLEKIPETGRAGFGDLVGSVNQVNKAAGSGVEAILGIKNIGIEAAEAGITSFDQLRQALLATGTDAQWVDALFQGFAIRGIKNIEDLKGATDSALGGVIADMEALGVNWGEFAQNTEDMKDATDQLSSTVGELANSIRGLASAINEIPDTKTVKINTESSGVNVTPNANGGVYKFARGGVVSRPTYFPMKGGLGLMGEAGTEAILPLKQIGGRLGVSADGLGGASNFTIVVNAQGAAAGVEQKIFAAIERLKPAILSDAIDIMNDASKRRT